MWGVDFFVGSVIGILSGLGVGSGGLLVIYLTLIGKTEQQDAQGINMLFFIFAASAAMIIHSKKRKINLPLLLTLITFGAPLSLLGSSLAALSRPEFLRKCFGGLLVFSGVVTLLSSFFKKEKKENKQIEKKY